jgi:hypothetical protein
MTFMTAISSFRLPDNCDDHPLLYPYKPVQEEGQEPVILSSGE